MSLDAPTGCSFSNVKAPKIKLEVIKDRFSNFQSTVSSGWQAVRGIHFAPRVSENGSFSRQSLAYVQASTQYLKQVSGLLKTGVATLRSSPSSYDVQGMWFPKILRSGMSSIISFKLIFYPNCIYRDGKFIPSYCRFMPANTSVFPSILIFCY